MRSALTAVVFGLAALAVPAVATAQEAESQVGGKNLDQWIKEMDNADASIRERALEAVQRYGRKLAQKAMGRIIYRIQHDDDLSPKVIAIIAAGDIGTEDPVYAKQLVEALMITLNHPQAIVKFQSAQTLGKLAENSPKALPALKLTIERLADNLNRPVSWKNQQAYAFALGRIAGGDKEKGTGPDMRAMIALANALRDDTKDVRMEAVMSLLMLGAPSAPKDALALQTILEGRLGLDPKAQYHERHKTVRVWIRLCLIRVNEAKYMNAASIAEIGKALAEPDLETRLAATNALGILETNAAPEVPHLLPQLDSEYPELAYATCIALGRIGDVKAVDALKKMDGHKEPAIKIAAREAIAKINGEKPKDADPAAAAKKD